MLKLFEHLKFRAHQHMTAADVLVKEFPFLKFNLAEHARNGTDLQARLHQTVKILLIDQTKKISEIKNEFELLGFTIRIFRKTGNVWVETTFTEDWTLQMQNAAAEQLNQ